MKRAASQETAPGTVGSVVDRRYRCGAAARWLPRSLGGAVLVAATLMALEVDATVVRMLPFVRQLVMAAGALVAWLIVRGGAEVRVVFGLTREALVVGTETEGARLPLADVERLDWAPPFSGSLSWIPAAVLLDRNGTSWRVPALLDGGDAMIRELLARAGRHDLDTWAEVYRVAERMGRSRVRIRTGYGVVVALLVAGTLHWTV